MAISHVAGQFGRGTNVLAVISVTMALTPVAGNILIATVGTYCGVTPSIVTSIVQVGVTWTKQISKSEGVGAFNAEIWLGVVVPGANTSITVNLDRVPTAGGVADVYEYSGILTSGFLDKTAVNNGNSQNPDTGTTVATTQADELWIGATDCTYAQSVPTNGFTLYDGVVFSFNSLAFLEKIVSSTGTANSGTTTAPNSYAWCGCIATFKGSAKAAPKGTNAAHAKLLGIV